MSGSFCLAAFRRCLDSGLGLMGSTGEVWWPELLNGVKCYLWPLKMCVVTVVECDYCVSKVQGWLSAKANVCVARTASGSGAGGVEMCRRANAHLESELLCWRQLCEEPAAHRTCEA